jgi:hypothetical protein
MRAARACAFTASSFYEASTLTAAMCRGVAIFGYTPATRGERTGICSYRPDRAACCPDSGGAESSASASPGGTRP